jgi:cytochrome c553
MRRARRPAGPLAAASALLLAACQGQDQGAATSAFQGDVSHGRAVVERTCAACHGADGNSTSPTIPKLAGQFPEYIVKQLKAFAADPGAPNARVSPTMALIAAKLSDTDMADVAAYYASLPRSKGAPRDAARLKLGEQTYTHGDPSHDLPACISCHRPSGQGIEPDFPVIGSQNAEYVDAQLTNWEANRGHHGKLMSLIVPHLQPDERQAVADYIAQLEPAKR